MKMKKPRKMKCLSIRYSLRSYKDKLRVISRQKSAFEFFVSIVYAHSFVRQEKSTVFFPENRGDIFATEVRGPN